MDLLGFLFGKKRESQPSTANSSPETAPSAKQLGYAKSLGIAITPEMTRQKVGELITEAENRSKHGEQFTQEFRRFEGMSIVRDAQFLMIYRSGKGIVVDVVEFIGDPEIVGDKNPYIKLHVSLPTLEKIDKGSHLLSWEKEIELRSDKVLHVQKLKKSLRNCSIDDGIESNDLKIYKATVEQGMKLAKQFEGK